MHRILHRFFWHLFYLLTSNEWKENVDPSYKNLHLSPKKVMWIIIYFVHRIQKPNPKVRIQNFHEFPHKPDCYWQKKPIEKHERFLKIVLNLTKNFVNIQIHSFGIGDLMRWARYFEIESLRYVRYFDFRKSLRFKQLLTASILVLCYFTLRCVKSALKYLL